MEAESVYFVLLKNERGRIETMLKFVKCNGLIEFIEASHMHTSAWMGGSSDDNFCSCLASAWPPTQSEARVHGDLKLTGHFLGRLAASTTAQPLSSSVCLCFKCGAQG